MSFDKFSHAGYQGTVRSEHARAVREYVAGKVDAELVKTGETRDVVRLPGLYVKRFRDPGIVRALGYSRARKEFDILRRLEEAGVAAPRPVACLHSRADALLVTEELVDAVVLKSIVAGGGLSFRERVRLMRHLGQFIAKMHDAGVDHGDLHAGNVLVRRKTAEFFVIDLHRAAYRRSGLSRRQRIFGVASMIFSLTTFLNLTDLMRLARNAGLKRSDHGVLLDDWRNLNHRYANSRAGRSLREGGSFAVEAGKTFRRREYAKEKIEQVLKTLASQPRKKALENRELVVVNETTFVKIFKRGSLARTLEQLAKGDPAVRSWKNAHQIAYRNVRTPQLYALVLQPGRSLLLGEWLPGALPLFDAVQRQWPKWNRKARNEFLYRLARFVRRVHEVGIYHKDLKANNVLVSETRFYLIDLDRVGFAESVGLNDRLLNLAQLNAAVATPVTRADRLRFYRYYAGWSSDWHSREKKNIETVMRITRRRRHLWP